MPVVSLPCADPSELGIDPAGIAGFLDALESDPTTEPHSLILLRHGRIAAQGWWSPYEPQQPQLLYSLSKTFAVTALGIAAGEGLLNLDDLVLPFFPEYQDDVTDDRVRRIRIRHLAAMASGHTVDTLEPAMRIDPDELVRGFLRTPPEREPGSVFAYNQPCTYTLAAVLTRLTGGTLVDYLRPRLLDPIGVGEVSWQHDPTGQELGWSGLHACTDAVARLGLLYLQGGRWRDRQILPPGWVAEATRSHIDTSGREPSDEPDWQRGYGLGLWMSRYGFRGDGAYGQFLIVEPDRDLVVALTAATDRMQAVLDAVWTHLLPACGSTAKRAGAADHALAERLRGLSLPPVSGSATPPLDSSRHWDLISTLEPAGGPVAAIALSRVDSRWRITVTGHPAGGVTGHVDIDVPGDRWVVSTQAGRGGPVPVAASGGWSDTNTLRLDLVFLNSPHRLRVICQLEPRTVDAVWVTNPLHNPPL